MTMQITIDLIESFDPCKEWTRERMERVARGRKSLTPLAFSRLRSVLPSDRLWVLLRPTILDKHSLRRFACDCAERALRRERRAGRKPDERSWEAVRVSRRFADGNATVEELAAARDAARDAWDAARAAARAAAWDAARAAAWAAARAAAWAAARAAERRWQLRRLRKYLTNGETK